MSLERVKVFFLHLCDRRAFASPNTAYIHVRASPRPPHAFNLAVLARSSWASLTRKLLERQRNSLQPPIRKNTHLYHSTAGAMVPKCHRLWASKLPHIGAKSNSSKLMAIITHATTIPGHTAHALPVSAYLVQLK